MKKLYISNFFALLLIFVFSQKAIAAEAPYIPPISDQTATVDDLYTFDVNAINADPAETYELVESRPGMTINPGTGVIMWTPSEPGDGGVVTVRAYNSAGESVRSFLIYITDAIVCADNLTSYWKMDETLGTSFEDFQGGFTATSLTPLQDTVGVVERGKSFNPLGQTDQFMFLTDQGQYDFARSNGFSISLWFRYHGQHLGYDNNQVLVGRGAPDLIDEMLYLLMIDVSSGNPKMTFSLRPARKEDPIKSVTPNVTISQNTWYHVAAVYEGAAPGQSSNLVLYINGARYSFPHIFGPADFVGNGNYNLNFGWWDRYPGNTYPFNGSMDEIVVYSKALSQGEVGNIYTDGQGGKPHCQPGNYFPLITSTVVEDVMQDEDYSYTITADDLDGDPLTFSADIIPGWLTFNPGSGLLSGTPDNDDVGDHTVKLKVTDGTTDVYQEFTLTVGNVNDAPEITSTPATTAMEGSAYSAFVEATDPDGDDLTFTADVLPTWLQFNPTTRLLIGIPQREDAGDNLVLITISDGEFDVPLQFTIVVTSDNNLPVFTSVPIITVDNFTEYVYQISAFDADVADVLSFSAEILPSWLTFDPVTKVLSGTPLKVHVGNHPVKIVVTDGYAEIPQEFTINVRDVNTAPVVTAEANDTAKVGTLYAYLMEVIDYDGDALTFSGLVIPGWLTFDPASRVLSGSPTTDNLGVHNVLITVSDGMFTVNYQFTITVVPQWGVGIDQTGTLVSSVYPNPAYDHLIFEFAGDASFVEISDLTGKVVMQEPVEPGASRIQLDVSELNNGLYLFRVFDADRHQTGKLIIK